MRHSNTRARRAIAAGFATAFFATLSACGPGDAPDGWGEEDHFDILIASDQAGGGRLVADYDFTSEVELDASQCIGGTGETCEGGILLRSSEAPGFSPLEEDEGDESLYTIAEDTPIELVLTSHDPEVSFFVNGTTLDQVGESVVLGMALEDLHVHGSWQVALPGGSEPAEDYFLAFRLRAPGSGYVESPEYVVTIHGGLD